MPALLRRWALALPLVAFTLLTGCRNPALVSHWAADSMRVDGLSRDWDKLPRLIVDNPRVSVGVSNDAHRLYLLLHANDLTLVRKLTQQGFTLWFDTHGKKRKTFGLVCRGNRLAGRGSEAERGHPDDVPAMDFAPPAQGRLAVVTGVNVHPTPVGATEDRGPAAESRREGSGFTYEISMPLTDADGEFAIGVAPGGVFSLGITLGHARRGARPPSEGGGPPAGGRGGPGGMGGPGGGEGGPGGEGGGPGGGGGGPGGGMGGPGGGGGGMRPGGGMRGGPAPEASADGPQEVWFEVTLANAATPAP